jgi:hypothetical protein
MVMSGSPAHPAAMRRLPCWTRNNSVSFCST